MIFFAITSTLSGMKDVKEVKKMGRLILGYTLLTTILAASIALALYLFVNPAKLSPIGDTAASLPASEGTYLSFFINMIPDNFIRVFVEGNVIGIVFMGMAIGIGTLFLSPEQRSPLHALFSGFFSLLLKLTGFLIKLMPIAIWAFVTLLVKELRQNYDNFNTLWLYVLTVIAANVIQGIVILPLLLKFKGLPVRQSFKAMGPALSMAFFSKSSNATLPLTMECIEKNAGVDKKVSSFSLPLCAVINMNGCAAFILITTLFVATLAGHTFGAFDYLCWIVIATLAAVGNAGVPMGCFFLTSAFLVGLNVPLYLMGLILPFYAIIDMIETTLNVWSDSCVTLIVDKKVREALPVEAAQSLA
jgi:Na+/H+-dicarboxylate symporter